MTGRTDEKDKTIASNGEDYWWKEYKSLRYDFDELKKSNTILTAKVKELEAWNTQANVEKDRLYAENEMTEKRIEAIKEGFRVEKEKLREDNASLDSAKRKLEKDVRNTYRNGCKDTREAIAERVEKLLVPNEDKEGWPLKPSAQTHNAAIRKVLALLKKKESGG